MPANNSDENGTHVLVTGNLVDGFSFIGPVTPNDPTLDAYVDTLSGQDWYYVQLMSLDEAVAINEDWSADPAVAAAATLSNAALVEAAGEANALNEGVSLGTEYSLASPETAAFIVKHAARAGEATDTCEECGASIPLGSLVNRQHELSCSLHPDNVN